MKWAGPEHKKTGNPIDIIRWGKAIGVSDFSISESTARTDFQRIENQYDMTIREHGFYHWLEVDDTGHAAAYTQKNNAHFVLLNQIFNGKVAERTLTGNYKVKGHEVRITVNQDLSDSSINSYNVFLDDRPIASDTGPGENSPFPFVSKMCLDFAGSLPDEFETVKMFNKMFRQKGVTVMVKSPFS